MSSFLYMPQTVWMAGISQVPGASVRGRYRNTNFISVSRQSLPTDPTGTVVVTLSGIKSGSEIHFFNQNGDEVAGTELASSSQAFTVQRYTSGSPNNTLRIFIASLGYENIDMSYELTESDATLPVFQRIDRNYRNPT